MATILIIDDNRDAADTLAALLILHGHVVSQAYDGEAGLDVIAAIGPAVVVSDLNMPGLDGYAVAQHVRDNRQIRQPYLIAFSGWNHEAAREKSQRHGFDLHLSKTAPITSILGAIAQATVSPSRDAGRPE